MKAYFGLTNWDWFQFLRAEPQLDEVNFWRPSDTRNFSLPPGSPFIFKLHQAHGGMIAGFGYLAGYTRQPMWAAWEAFERKNGAASFSNCHRMIATIRAGRGLESDPAGTFEIGCLMLSNPVFFDRSSWILPPSDWPRSGIQVGKPIDITGSTSPR